MKISGIFLYFLVSLSSVLTKESNIKPLNEDDFFPFIDSNPNVLVKYCAPWYSECTETQSIYEKAAENMKDANVKFAEVDCTLESELCVNNGVEKYPTIQLHREGNVLNYKNANITASEIEMFVNSYITPALVEVNEQSLEKMEKENDKVIIAFLDNIDSTEYQNLFKVSYKLRDEYKFVYSFDKELAKKNNGEIPCLVNHKKHNTEKDDVRLGSFTESELEMFIKISDLPLMDNLNSRNYEKYLETNIPLFYFFIDDEKYEETIGKDIEDMARRYRLKMSFIYVDAKKYGEQAETLGIKEDWPSIVIQDPLTKLKYLFDKKNGFEKEEIEKFLIDYFDGKIKSFFHSETLGPRDPEDELIRMNAYTFEEVALNKKKDVFVLFYAEYCKPCREALPVLRKIAKEIEPKDKFDIAYIDATKNDIPGKSPFNKIDGFPTFVLFRANRKNEPVLFPTNDYYEADYKDFIEQYAVNDVTFEKVEKDEL